MRIIFAVCPLAFVAADPSEAGLVGALRIVVTRFTGFAECETSVAAGFAEEPARAAGRLAGLIE